MSIPKDERLKDLPRSLLELRDSAFRVEHGYVEAIYRKIRELRKRSTPMDLIKNKERQYTLEEVKELSEQYLSELERTRDALSTFLEDDRKFFSHQFENYVKNANMTLEEVSEEVKTL